MGNFIITQDTGPVADETFVQTDLGVERQRIEMLRAKDPIAASMREDAYKNGTYERGIREMLGVAAPVTPPPAAPGHSAGPVTYAPVERPYGADLLPATHAAISEIPASLNLDAQWGGYLNTYIVEACDAFRGKDAGARANIAAGWEASNLHLAKSEAGAKERLAYAESVLSRTTLGRDLVKAGAHAYPMVVNTLWNLKTAADSFKK